VGSRPGRSRLAIASAAIAQPHSFDVGRPRRRRLPRMHGDLARHTRCSWADVLVGLVCVHLVQPALRLSCPRLARHHDSFRIATAVPIAAHPGISAFGPGGVYSRGRDGVPDSYFRFALRTLSNLIEQLISSSYPVDRTSTLFGGVRVYPFERTVKTTCNGAGPAPRGITTVPVGPRSAVCLLNRAIRGSAETTDVNKTHG
jgi:hypothetical protein